jgi:PAS domain S-box-containing protein
VTGDRRWARRRAYAEHGHESVRRARKEGDEWKISHSSISIPYHLVREGEVYPLQGLAERNQFLEELVAERTRQLSEANARLQNVNEELTCENAERGNAESALQESEARYRSILNASPDDITITDLHGRIVMVSPMALTMFGYTGVEEFLGRHVTDFLIPEDRQRAATQIAAKARGLTTGPSAYLALRPDGSTFHLEVNSDFMRDAAGAPTGMVIIARDVSERKRVEAESERLESHNRKLQRVESLGRMAGAIAHHFNNKLQAVIMGMELAINDLPPGSGPLENLTDALTSARKAAEISGSMLAYLGQSAGRRDPMDLAEACLRSLTLLRAAAPKGVVLETDVHAPGPSVVANESELQQVVANLLTNAYEAMGEREGAIRIAVRTVASAELAARHRFPVDFQWKDAAYACLEVADSGAGIAVRDIESLFDPFFSSKSAGRGLGLPVVLGIVRAHGGAITVQSEPGRGSTFCVALPLATEAVARKPVALRPVSRVAERGTVLVVDDEPAVRRAVTRALTRFGFTVLEAFDGLDALETFRRQRDEIGCVLCDVTMPRMNGWETLSALRELSPAVPVIMASGYSEALVMAGAHAEQPQAFLSKPFEVQALVDALDQAMAGRKG